MLPTSIRTFPASRFSPAARRASSELAPWVQLKSTSPKPAASAKFPVCARAPARFAQPTAFGFLASREPIITSCPSATSFEAIASPTIPVPSTPIFIVRSGSRRSRPQWLRPRLGSYLFRVVGRRVSVLQLGSDRICTERNHEFVAGRGICRLHPLHQRLLLLVGQLVSTGVHRLHLFAVLGQILFLPIEQRRVSSRAVTGEHSLDALESARESIEILYPIGGVPVIGVSVRAIEHLVAYECRAHRAGQLPVGIRVGFPWA